jgi:hypothetical protein
MPAARVRARENQRTIHTTLGELVAAISDVAFEYAPDPKEAYEIARLVLRNIMKNRIACATSH